MNLRICLTIILFTLAGCSFQATYRRGPTEEKPITMTKEEQDRACDAGCGDHASCSCHEFHNNCPCIDLAIKDRQKQIEK